jgi:hypothetical protein
LSLPLNATWQPIAKVSPVWSIQIGADAPFDLSLTDFTGYSDRLFAERSVLWHDEALVDKPISPTGLREAVSLSFFRHTRD